MTGRRLHAVPVRVATRRSRAPADRRRRIARGRRTARWLRDCRPRRGSVSCCRRGWTGTTRRCSTCCASRDKPAGAGCPRVAHGAGTARSMRVALFLREHAAAWQTLRFADQAERGAIEEHLDDGARRVLMTLRSRGRVLPAGSGEGLRAGRDDARERDRGPGGARPRDGRRVCRRPRHPARVEAAAGRVRSSSRVGRALVRDADQ